MAFTVTKSNRRKKTQADSEKSEFDGLWINVGVVTSDEETGEETFNRLPRGIAVADLDLHKVYASTHERNPAWAEEATVVNALINKIREVASQLEEGEAKPAQLAVQLYRKQEQVEAVDGKTEVSVDLDVLF